MIIDYYKFKKDSEVSNNYILSSATSHSERIPPERIKFLPVKDNTSSKNWFRLVFDKETTAHVIFPSKNKGFGFFEIGYELILINWFPQISRIHILIIQYKKNYAEMFYQMFINGLINFNSNPSGPYLEVQ